LSGTKEVIREISVKIIAPNARFTIKRFVKGEIIETTPK
jgi:hypothetical protein